MKTRSAAASLAAPSRDEFERLSAEIVTKIELPALMLQVATGIVFLVTNPEWFTHGWIHGKLTCVAILLGLSHAGDVQRAPHRGPPDRQGDGASARIAPRKSRHGTYGAVGSLVVVVLVVLVACRTG